jgi:hypothetical protein
LIDFLAVQHRGAEQASKHSNQQRSKLFHRRGNP